LSKTESGGLPLLLLLLRVLEHTYRPSDRLCPERTIFSKYASNSKRILPIGPSFCLLPE